ncbi:hypothetical protein GCM10020254_02630 [Streptomyces goshikiensis]
MAPASEGHPEQAPGTPSTPRPGAGRYGEALFRPEQPGEGDRIDHAALVYDPFTRQRLRSLGVGPGWRCLEAGAGTGTIARWLAEEAGADEVVALDRDTSRLEPLAGPRLRVHTADLTRIADEPDLGTFDLVHARFVLMHLPERRALVSRLAERLNPGGFLVLSDAADVPDPADPHSAYRQTLNAMWRTLAQTIGTDIAAVRAHPPRAARRRPVGCRRRAGLPAADPGHLAHRLLERDLAADAARPAHRGRPRTGGPRRGARLPRLRRPGRTWPRHAHGLGPPPGQVGAAGGVGSRGRGQRGAQAAAAAVPASIR